MSAGTSSSFQRTGSLSIIGVLGLYNGSFQYKIFQIIPVAEAVWRGYFRRSQLVWDSVRGLGG